MSLKSFSFGLGLGIAFVSILSLVLIRMEVKKVEVENQNQAAAVEMSDEDVINRAKELGMIFYTELPSKKDAEKEDESALEDSDLSEDRINDEDTPDLTEEEQENIREDDENFSDESGEDVKTVHLTIKSGAMAGTVSADLQKKGLIDDAEDFKNYLIQNKYSTKVLTGEFEIPEGSDYDEIIDIIVDKKLR